VKELWKECAKLAKVISLAVVLYVVSPCGAVAQLGARLDGIEEVVGSNPIGSTNFS
jgi:hypothetical protein